MMVMATWLSNAFRILIAVVAYYAYNKKKANELKFPPKACMFYQVQQSDPAAPSWIDAWEFALQKEYDDVQNPRCMMYNDILKMRKFNISSLHPPMKKASSAGIFRGCKLTLSMDPCVVRVALTSEDSKITVTSDEQHSESLFVEDIIREKLLDDKSVSHSVLVPRMASLSLCEPRLGTYGKGYYHIQLYEEAKGGDLEEWVKSRISLDCFKFGDSAEIMKTVLRLVYTLHQSNILHADLRLANFLVMEDESCMDIDNARIVLSDLSRTRILRGRSYDFEWIYEDGTENVKEFAPEARQNLSICLSKNNHPECKDLLPWEGITTSIDIFSLGVIFEQLILKEIQYLREKRSIHTKWLDIARKMSQKKVSRRPKLDSVRQFLMSYY